MEKLEKILSQDLVIDDVHALESRFQSLYHKEMDWSKIEHLINTDRGKVLFFFDEELRRKQENDRDIVYAWIDTGYDTEEGESIFLSLLKNPGGYYSGHFVGAGNYLVYSFCQRSPYIMKKIKSNYAKFCSRKDTDRFTEREVLPGTKGQKTNITLHTVGVTRTEELPKKEEELIAKIDPETEKRLTDVTEEMYHALSYPKWESIYGLDAFIKTIGKRVTQLMEQGRTEYFIANHIQSVIVNTGLIDKYGNDCLVLYRKHANAQGYVAYKWISGKRECVEEGFTNEQLAKEIKPISFIDDREFHATFEDFDLNSKCLRHIIDERIDRFPKELQTQSMEYLSLYIKHSLEQGLKRQERDHSYIRPIYSDGKVSWLLPLYFGVDAEKEPTLVMVIRKSTNFYELKTILPYDEEIKDKITAMSLYQKMW